MLETKIYQKENKLRISRLLNDSITDLVGSRFLAKQLAVRDIKAQNIFSRKYFYPSLNNLGYVKSSAMSFSENVSSKILCLPLYVGLTKT